MSKRQRIKDLELELTIIHNELWCRSKKGRFHARHGKKFGRYVDIVRELETISIKWKIKKSIKNLKKYFRRKKYHG